VAAANRWTNPPQGAGCIMGFSEAPDLCKEPAPVQRDAGITHEPTAGGENLSHGKSPRQWLEKGVDEGTPV